MGVRTTVFGSKAEFRNFQHLRQQWTGSYELYHNLPFLNVYTIEKLYDWKKQSTWTISDDDFGRVAVIMGDAYCKRELSNVCP